LTLNTVHSASAVFFYGTSEVRRRASISPIKVEPPPFYSAPKHFMPSRNVFGHRTHRASAAFLYGTPKHDGASRL